MGEGASTLMPRDTILQTIEPQWRSISAIVRQNSERVIQAFADQGASQADLAGTTGYGYDDRGRQVLDEVVAQAFGADSAVVRALWVSGTHVLVTALKALLEPGDHLWLAGGRVYDTLRPLLGRDHSQSLGRRGVKVFDVACDANGQFHPQPGTPLPKVVFIQRSRGYSLEPSWDRRLISAMIQDAHRLGAWVLVDNCYGEFTEVSEPTAWGADLIAGSLLKNPGGGVAPTGGYVAGRRELVDRIADELTAPTMGREVGPTGSYLRLFAQGFFLAPGIVGEALMGAAYARALWHQAGVPVEPRFDVVHEMITAIRLGRPDRVEKFCRVVQSLGPMDSRAVPEAWDMPGYDDKVIMAAGGMIAGGSLELSCDAPMRPPYWVYLQGGLSRWHMVMAAERTLQVLCASLE